MHFITCKECGGSGHMNADRAYEIERETGEPVMRMYGCEACQGEGEVEVDEDDE